MPSRLYITFLRLPVLIRILFITLLFLIAFGIAVHFLEPETFLTIYDGIWWAFITATTVGYGDYVPQSFLGRTAAVLLILFGAGLVSFYLVSLATAAVTKQNAFSEGRLAFKGMKHIAIVGWNERSREIISKLNTSGIPVDIVLIDETLDENPIDSRYIHFIKGKPHVDGTILKGNVSKAEMVLITADHGHEETQADMNSILTLLTIKGLCPEVKCIVEILTPEQVVNAKRAGADQVLQSNRLTSIFMLSSLHSKGAGLLMEIIGELQENRLDTGEAGDSFAGKSFAEVKNIWAGRESLLIGVSRGDELMINPPLSLTVESGDQLISIK
ncbi:potassium channel protein [Neobacillus notoginsengisoli]|uniref:Potassium channel protein n=1 Tax=Neobacillus notoginsengisoli TaxID=1578198 RepID=A0A417YY72_9BACI|nr:potassium channel family protein [Neobacillus notoginsengisoli]RHW42605.1 potassium channel protein [Neobacillus notoginsengisoli]